VRGAGGWGGGGGGGEGGAVEGGGEEGRRKEGGRGVETAMQKHLDIKTTTKKASNNTTF